MYTPDFLVVKRKDGEIHKAIIVETKGAIYANDPTFKDKRTVFIPILPQPESQHSML